MKAKAPQMLAVIAMMLLGLCPAEQAKRTGSSAPDVSLQPFADEIRRLQAALALVGEPLSSAEQTRIRSALAGGNAEPAVRSVEEVLNKYKLAVVRTNAESQLTVTDGEAQPTLAQAAARAFLVRINNGSGVTAALAVWRAPIVEWSISLLPEMIIMTR